VISRIKYYQTWIQDLLLQDQDQDSEVPRPRPRPRLWCPRPRPRLKTYKTNTVHDWDRLWQTKKTEKSWRAENLAYW